MLLLSIDDARSWIESSLLTKEGRFAPRHFEFSATIFRLQLRGSFVATLINGAQENVSFWAPAGRNRYSVLLRNLGMLTGRESAFWFYMCDSPEGQSTLNWVKTARFDPQEECLDAPLEHFETDPAKPGGAAYLGLIAASSNWLLLHTHYAEEEFEISILGNTKLCTDLCQMVKSRETP